MEGIFPLKLLENVSFNSAKLEASIKHLSFYSAKCISKFMARKDKPKTKTYGAVLWKNDLDPLLRFSWLEVFYAYVPKTTQMEALLQKCLH